MTISRSHLFAVYADQIVVFGLPFTGAALVAMPLICMLVFAAAFYYSNTPIPGAGLRSRLLGGLPAGVILLTGTLCTVGLALMSVKAGEAAEFYLLAPPFYNMLACFCSWVLADSIKPSAGWVGSIWLAHILLQIVFLGLVIIRDSKDLQMFGFVLSVLTAVFMVAPLVLAYKFGYSKSDKPLESDTAK